MSFLIGAAKTEITPDSIGVVLMGWGDPRQKAKGVATPLYARAVAIVDPITSKRIVMVCLDLCFVTERLRREVLNRTKLKPEELMISATHTHSAPGGFSDYVFFSLPNRGFIPHVFERYVSQTVVAIEQALGSLVGGNLRFGRDSFSDAAPVAFNRSIRAYNRNPDVVKHPRDERHLAVDREMTLLRFDDLQGKPIAVWNWFAVHGTSVHRNRKLVHSDNKGRAAVMMEEALSERGVANFVAVFAQGAAGDVSPNFRYFIGMIEKRGQFRDDFKSCDFNAQLQVNLAIRIFDAIREAQPLPRELNSVLMYGDLSQVQVDSDFVEGKQVHTGPAEVGLSQFGGTSEGRGISIFERVLIRVIYGFIRWVNRDHFNTETQGKKFTVIEAGESMMFGAKTIEKFPMPGWINPMIDTVKRWGRAGIFRMRPFIPQILPLQILRIGNLVIPVVPGEFTTTSGRRMRKMLEDEFCRERQLTVLFQGYANVFNGYTTTPEEYDQQGYEGGSTFYGKWSLPAYLTLYRQLARRLFDENCPLSSCPPPEAPSAGFLAVLMKKGLTLE